MVMTIQIHRGLLLTGSIFLFTLALGFLITGAIDDRNDMIMVGTVPMVFLASSLMIGFIQTAKKTQTPKTHLSVNFAFITSVVLLLAGVYISSAMTSVVYMLVCVIPAIILGTCGFFAMHRLEITYLD